MVYSAAATIILGSMRVQLLFKFHLLEALPKIPYARRLVWGDSEFHRCLSEIVLFLGNAERAGICSYRDCIYLTTP
jgi:hypothetical protein